MSQSSLTLEKARPYNINHGIALKNSRTTKEAERKEKALATIYRSIGKLIINDPEYPNLGNIRNYFDEAYVYPVTQRAVHDVYLLGVDYVNLLLRTQGFLDKTKDDPRIDAITTEMVETFWRKIRIYTNRFVERKNAIDAKVDPSRIPKLFDLPSMLNQTATTLTTWTLKTATVEKMQDLREQLRKLDYRTVRNEIKGSIAIKGMGRAILEDINAVARKELETGGGKRRLTTDDISYIWFATLDEVTCRKLPNGGLGCRYLHGTEWSFDNAFDVPTPSGTGRNPTHYNCRCRIIIKIGNDAFFA